MKNGFRGNTSILITAAILVGVILLITFPAGKVIAQVHRSSGEEFEEIDLASWVKEYSKLGNTAFRAGELFMRAKQRDRYYYVLVAPEDYSTTGRSTRVTLRNVRGWRTKLGYGLIFHSTSEPLVQDYIFVIDTVTKRYRVARHKSNKESTVIEWTKSPFIRRGKRPNVLDITDRGEYVDLYINQRFVRSVKTPFAIKDGQPGLYTDATPIAFKDFALTKIDAISRQIAELD